MNIHCSLRICAMAIVGASVLLGTPALAQERVSVFTSFEDPSVTVAADTGAQLALIREDPSVVDIRIGQIDVNGLSTADELSFAAPGSAALDLGAVSRSVRAASDYSLFASAEDGVEASMAVSGDDVVGVIRTRDKTYKIVPLGGGTHALVEVDLSVLQDHPQGFNEDELDSTPLPQNLPDIAPEDTDVMDSGASIDIIVAYTNRARLQAGNINALIQLAVDETNQSYRNSGVIPRINLVQSYQTNYTESGNMVTDRNRFRDNGDGFMDEIHARRNLTRADVAMLLIGSGGGCGIASAILANADNAFAVTRQNCATGNFTFGHEIGHLQGARHNPEQDPSTAPFAYGHGFCNDPSNWRTIMSYNTASRCPNRVQWWSSPNARFSGQPTGNATTRNNVRVLNGTAPLIANFRVRAGTPCRSGFLAAGSRLCISNRAQTPRTYANATTRCRDLRARVASYGDLRYLFVRSALDPAYNPSGRWIGNFVDDDRALCGNRAITSDNDSDIGNFEGTCSRFDTRGFWCAYDR